MNPLILTLTLDPVSQAFFDRERRLWFPPAINLIPAHVTLFHHLPGDGRDQILGVLQDHCARHPAMPFTAEGLRFLGRGVAYRLHAPGAAAAQALLGRDQDHFGVCLLSLALTLDPVQCRKLFVGPNGAYDWKVYAAAYCSVEKAILAGDHNSAERSLLFNANPRTWGDLHAAGAAPNIERILVRLGMSEVQARLSVTDVITAVWWADAMAAYAKALDNSKPLEAAGKQVVKNSTIGYSEPWMVLASWKLTGEPAINAELVTSLPKPVLAAGQ